MAAFKTYTFMLLGLLLAVYLNYPAPSNMSNNLIVWKTKAAKAIIFNKNKIFYKDEPGTKLNAPVLVCLHGFPTSSYDWLKVWPGLLQKFRRVMAPDFLGFGLSDKPTDHNYTITEQADLVEHLLHYQRVKEVHILAHDYGDTVAQELLARYEDRLKDGVPKLIIKSVCFLNGGLFPDTNFPQPIQQALLVPYVGDVLARLTNIYTFKRSFGSVFGPDTQPTDEDFDDFWTLIRNSDGNLIIPKLLQYIPERTAQKYRWTGVLQKTKVPVHVIYGPADPVNPPGFVSFYRDIIPDASISVLEGHIGHYPQWEDSANCMAAYFNFLRTLPFSGSPQSQPTPKITTSTRTTGQKPPPKVVLEKMKVRQEEAERAKSSAADKHKETQQKKDEHRPVPKVAVSPTTMKEKIKSAKEMEKRRADATSKVTTKDLPKEEILEKKSKHEQVKTQKTSKEVPSLKEIKSSIKNKKPVIKEAQKPMAQQEEKTSEPKQKDKLAKVKQVKTEQERKKPLTKTSSEQPPSGEKVNVKKPHSSKTHPEEKSEETKPRKLDADNLKNVNKPDSKDGVSLGDKN
ncbi:hypothetical protein LSH36_166g05089 [Paralvinella palmiformis]|uniref:AB hydrolase-1 domain-containing protein n=1 Tax=Paralvinella palmiformis TaxID=53620 RepID=A0AAD9JSR5_9ANNE|nr:hypothetical protein LSH36_166g05089 [Paralvinella palmiformis]